MCGVAGVLRLDGQDVDHGEIETLNLAQAHRGPDGAGMALLGPVAFGHRRLAIIDPAGGRQPMCTQDQSLWLVANGEIYNFRQLSAELTACGHRFRTRNDCEVILHGYAEWGDAIVSRLRGMFAFAIWDMPRQRLFLARDRIGIKPLCYSLTPERFAFASELQALRLLPGFDASVDLEALDSYLHLQYIPAPKSIYNGAKKLPPGHTLSLTLGQAAPELKRYWRLQWRPEESVSEAQWIERIDAALNDAIRSHLVADVPFGAFLSGGVDSSTVVAYMAANGVSPLRTFSIGFEEAEFDERAYAKEAAERIGSDHHETVVGLDASELLPRLVRHYGEPFADSSALCTWKVCEVARRQVPMVLSGDGGDEVFAGYSYFPKLVERHPTLTHPLRRARRFAGNMLRQAGMLNSLPTLAESWHGRSPCFSEPYRRRLWRPEHRHLMDATAAWNQAQFRSLGGLDTLTQCQSVDIQNYLPFDNLNKVDISSMAHGLEVRVPLLDHELLDAVTRIPPRFRLAALPGACAEARAQWCGKYVLKRVANRFFSWEFLERPKMGFSVPIGTWLAGPLKAHLREQLFARASGLDDWFELAEIERLLSEHGRIADHGHRLWALLVLAQWRWSTRV